MDLSLRQRLDFRILTLCESIAEMSKMEMDRELLLIRRFGATELFDLTVLTQGSDEILEVLVQSHIERLHREKSNVERIYPPDSTTIMWLQNRIDMFTDFLRKTK